MEKEITNTTLTETTKLITASNIWEDLKERLSAPFFASFIISWIICNWKIIIILFWFGKDVDGPSGATTRIEMIYQHSNCWRTLWIPFGLAILYCVGYPAFKALTDWIVAHIKTYFSEKILIASGKAKVDMTVFLTLKQQYDNANKNLENIIKEASIFQSNRAALEQELNTAKIELASVNDKLSNEILENKKYKDNKDKEDLFNNVKRLIGRYRLFLPLEEDKENTNLDNKIEIVIHAPSTKTVILRIDRIINKYHSEENFVISGSLSDFATRNTVLFLSSANRHPEDNLVDKILILKEVTEFNKTIDGLLIDVHDKNRIILERY